MNDKFKYTLILPLRILTAFLVVVVISGCRSVVNDDFEPFEADGATACNTCHGNKLNDASIFSNWAPPTGLGGTDQISDPGVGVHQSHVLPPNNMSKPIECKTCHVVPTSLYSPGHLDNEAETRAEVVFSSPATSDSSEPVYNPDDNTCRATYCHGDGVAKWTEVGGWNDCDDCHGTPPGGDHPQWPTLAMCKNCHGEVIDGNGDIIAPNLHVNGSVNKTN